MSLSARAIRLARVREPQAPGGEPRYGGGRASTWRGGQRGVFQRSVYRKKSRGRTVLPGRYALAAFVISVSVVAGSTIGMVGCPSKVRCGRRTGPRCLIIPITGFAVPSAVVQTGTSFQRPH